MDLIGERQSGLCWKAKKEFGTTENWSCGVKPGDLVKVTWRFDTPRLGLVVADPAAHFFPQVLVELVTCGRRVSFDCDNVEVVSEAR